MKAYQTLWTTPMIINSELKSKEFFLDDLQLVSMILSVLYWRKTNGTIKLYTDTVGLEYLAKLNILDLWDDGIDIETINNMENNYKFNYKSLWAAAKIFALEQEKAPVVSVDIDLFVYKNINDFISSNKDGVVGYHFENTTTQTGYVPAEFLYTPDGYEFDKNLDWSVNPINTALTYFGNENCKQIYIEEAKRFIKNNMGTSLYGNTSQMIFVEQRLLSMLCKASNTNLTSFVEDETKYIGPDFFHLWGLKNQLSYNKDKYNSMVHTLLYSLINNFPDYECKVKQINCLNKYMRRD